MSRAGKSVERRWKLRGIYLSWVPVGESGMIEMEGIGFTDISFLTATEGRECDD